MMKMRLFAFLTILISVFLMLLLNCTVDPKNKEEDDDDEAAAVIPGKWSSQSIKTASDGTDSDYFGCSVAVSGDYAITGGYEDNGSRGVAYIYHRTGDNVWGEEMKLTASDAAVSDWFGYSVSISGDYAIVGAYYEDGAGTDRGAAYIYRRTSGNTWGEEAKLTAGADAADGDNFGYSVSISGDYALIGALSKTGGGAAYVFYRTGINAWSNVTKITASDRAGNDNFGVSVALSGNYAVIGASGEDGAGTDRGAAYIYYRSSGNTWGTEEILYASDAANNDNFGISVAVSGNYAVIGAFGEDGAGTDRGAAYIYYRSSGNIWENEEILYASDTADTDNFGISVGISGDYTVVGAHNEDGAGIDRGAVYVFHRISSNSWDFSLKLTSSDAANDDLFGRSAAVSGDYAVVGAQLKDGAAPDSGAIYFFK